ncbi:rhodanese-like domain-containing protein [Paludisphaera mucosa]|uniref:Rhodanese-like domain-containing protein n=1 Tax=Paludisphaera mucosa TaxID=3030827 RepID=A0ABT6F8P7_9BACT|nr:rhodanese-like domain-containing protein [Paludisphaera mucosa]MDG3003866.1 rhodanese-like domain-containing protein [Paludisphaera mucosa]
MANAHASIASISPAELFEISQSKGPIELIDVRTPAEFREIHATPARSVPLDRLDPVGLMQNRERPDDPLYVICRSGSRGRQACEAFAAAGFGDQVVNVEGGTLAWEQGGLPVARGKKTISLERQIRIIAGSIVVLGVVLGAVVSPWFTGLSAFIGAGLVFAGVTDVCPMGMSLARMPWNQAGGDSATCSR